MLGVCHLRRKGFFQERIADSFGAAHFFQGAGSPRSAFHHLGKQGQPDANDFVILGQAGDGLLQELRGFPVDFVEIFRQFPKGPTEHRQHFFGVRKIEEIGERDVFSLD